jgi:hypothetical protein
MNRIEILQRLAAGEITVDEATRLLQQAAEAPAEASAQEMPATEQPAEPAAPSATEQPERLEKRKAGDRARWLRIRVGKAGSDKDHVRINIPLGLVNAGVRLGAHFGNQKWVEAWDEMLESLERGETATLIEVDDERDGERVRIYVD